MMDLDSAFALFQRKEAEVKAALEQCEAEQAAGRIGLEAYRRAKALSEELTALGAALGDRIEKELASL